MASELTLVGRSSSHFTRIVRIYAAELQLSLDFEPVLELMSSQSTTFGGNPLLTVPSLRAPEGTWFGSMNCCRALAHHAQVSAGLLWPEDLKQPVLANAQEVVLSAMNAGVSVIMGRNSQLDDEHPSLLKPHARLRGAVAWLEQNLDLVLAALPPHTLSFLEASTFAFLTHLSFRGLGNLDTSPKLQAFCEIFSARSAAQSTGYHFDQPRVTG